MKEEHHFVPVSLPGRLLYRSLDWIVFSFAWLLILPGLVLWVMDIVYMEKYGQTIFKRALNQRLIVVETGEKAGFGLYLVRGIIYFCVTIWLLWLPDIIMIAVREDRRSLADLVAGTQVVQVK